MEEPFWQVLKYFVHENFQGQAKCIQIWDHMSDNGEILTFSKYSNFFLPVLCLFG